MKEKMVGVGVNAPDPEAQGLSLGADSEALPFKKYNLSMRIEIIPTIELSNLEKLLDFVERKFAGELKEGYSVYFDFDLGEHELDEFEEILKRNGWKEGTPPGDFELLYTKSNLVLDIGAVEYPWLCCSIKTWKTFEEELEPPEQLEEEDC